MTEWGRTHPTIIFNTEVEIADFLLRPALESDAVKIRDLIRRADINPFDLNWQHFIVAETAGGAFIGCAQLKRHKDQSVELASLAVEIEYRGQGVARALIEHLLTQSPRPLYLMCRPELGVFYAPFGFKAIGADEMSPYFRRLVRVIRVFVSLVRREGPLIMRLD
jgi:N-acetylglutamate synthase-like GNAT family acetyltransferase